MADPTPRLSLPHPNNSPAICDAGRDRAPDVARWLVEEAAPVADPWRDVHSVAAAMRERWPDLSADEVTRAVDIATEVKLTAITEQEMER